MIERRKDCDHGEQCPVIVILTFVAKIRVYLRKVVYYFDTSDSNNNTAATRIARYYYYSSVAARLELFREILRDDCRVFRRK